LIDETLLLPILSNEIFLMKKMKPIFEIYVIALSTSAFEKMFKNHTKSKIFLVIQPTVQPPQSRLVSSVMQPLPTKCYTLNTAAEAHVLEGDIVGQSWLKVF
jgi:hypothetical protein